MRHIALLRPVILSTILMTSAESVASTSQPGLVSNLIVNRAGRLFFDQAGQRGDVPACSVYRRWVVDVTNSAGQATMALILSAQAQNKRLIVQGAGDCRDWADTEAVDYVQVVG